MTFQQIVDLSKQKNRIQGELRCINARLAELVEGQHLLANELQTSNSPEDLFVRGERNHHWFDEPDPRHSEPVSATRLLAAMDQACHEVQRLTEEALELHDQAEQLGREMKQQQRRKGSR